MDYNLDQDCFPFFRLPDELIYKIFSLLYGIDLARLRMVSFQFNDLLLSDDQLAWRNAIYSELTTNPQPLLSDESYYNFYKRAYLGLYRCVVTKLAEDRITSLDYEASFFLEKEYSYCQYLKEKETTQEEEMQQGLSTMYRLYHGCRQYRLDCYLILATKHGYEIWANKLCQQGANVHCHKQTISPLIMSIRENNDTMIKNLIELGIRYHLLDPQCLVRSNSYECVFHVMEVCKVLTCIRHDSHLLQPFINIIDLPSIHQAAIFKSIDEFRKYFEDGKYSYANLRHSDAYGMTPLMYCIILGREDIVSFIYGLKKKYLHSSILSKCCKAILSRIEFKVLKVIRVNDRTLYKAVISELFKDENFFTSNSIKDIQQLVLTDLTRKEVFYTACYGAITSRSHHAIHSLMSDLPKLLQLCMQSATDIQRLLKRITRTRQKVIAHYGRELLFRAIEYGQDAYILQLAIEGIRLSVDNYDLLWQSIKIFLYDHYLLTPSTIIYKLSPISAVINNIDYRRFHQFILRLSNEDFDANSTVETLQLYKLAKAISDLPITLPLDVSLDNCIVEIMFEVMKNADLSCPLFQDHQLQKRLDEIIYVLLDKLIHLIKDYHNINICVNIGKNVFYQETLLHRAARYQNPAWIRLLLQAGADREIKDSGLIKPVHHADKWDRHQIPMRVHTDRQIHHAGEWARNWECRHLLRNLQSCPLPS